MPHESEQSENIKTENTEPKEVTAPVSGPAQAELVHDLLKNLESDSILPEGKTTKEVLNELKNDTLRIADPMKRSHGLFEIAMYSQKLGERELFRELSKLSGEAEREFMSTADLRDKEGIEKLKLEISAYLNNDTVTLDAIKDSRNTKIKETDIE